MHGRQYRNVYTRCLFWPPCIAAAVHFHHHFYLAKPNAGCVCVCFLFPLLFCSNSSRNIDFCCCWPLMPSASATVRLSRAWLINDLDQGRRACDLNWPVVDCACAHLMCSCKVCVFVHRVPVRIRPNNSDNNFSRRRFLFIVCVHLLSLLLYLIPSASF